MLYAFFMGISVCAQQVVVNGNVTPQELIVNELFQGCIQISNVNSALNGNVNGISSFGTFVRGSSNFPFEEGIVLTTGKVTDAGNVINTVPLNEGETNWAGDADLETILGVSNTYNATSIEFDIVTASDIIRFNYILASEEYLNDYPCNYSDSFAFLIKPSDNSAPYTNITLIPGTDTPVSTHTIRPAIVGFCESENEEYFDGFNVGDTNYNGRTTVLTAQTQIQPNTSYHIKLVIADQFDENFDSAVFIEGHTFNSLINLGGTLNTCNDQLTINTGITNPQATFVWDYNGLPLTDTTPAITALQSGTYHVVATIPYADNVCIAEDNVIVNLNGFETSAPVTDFKNCALENQQETSTFDLTLKDEELAASVPFTNSVVTYYTSSQNAQNNTNPITEPIQNSTNPQMVYARITNPDTQCVAFNSFNLIVNQKPVVSQPENLIACGSNETDIAEFDLSIAGYQATNYNPDLSLSYFASSENAESQIDSLPALYTNTENFETVYIRATNNTTGCYSIVPVLLEVAHGPQITSPNLYIDACQPQAGGFSNFDLTSITSQLVENPSDYDIAFFTAEQNAINYTAPIPNPENFTNTVADNQSVYVRITDLQTECYTITTVNLYMSMLTTEMNTQNYEICDDATNDGTEPIDLAYLHNYITNGLENTNISFYISEEDLSNNINALDQSEPFFNTSNPQILYFYIESEGSCGVSSEIILQINPNFSVPSIGPQTYCDTDSDGITDINLEEYTGLINNGNNYAVQYFLSENSAQELQNPITQFTNTLNPQTIWAVVSNSSGTCKDIISFPIEVLAAPDTFNVNDIHICDDDTDGISIVDLTQVIPQLINDTTNVTIEFYRNRNNAEEGTNQIENPENYSTATHNIFIKTINNQTGCYNIRNFKIYVAFFEDLTEDRSTFMLCESDGDEKEPFFFGDYDDIILQEEPGLIVKYYATEADALNNVNAITKNAPYLNTSNPQVLYIRRQSAFDVTCYAVDPITIKVNSYPAFNSPQDIFLCDDISNNGQEIFDFSDAVTQMGIDPNVLNVTFHTTRNNAINGTNPLPMQYQNTVNPQTIWVKVETQQGCYEAVSFKLNVIHVGLINQPSPISYCDTDANGYEIVDLKSDDVDVLMIRQNEILLTYYQTEQDAVNLTNAIADPEHYHVNVTQNGEPTTLFIVATNSISNCSLYVPLDITVFPVPQFTTNTTFNVCQDSISSLWLPSLNDLIITNNNQIQFSYYNTLADAENGTNPLPETIPVSNTSVSVYAKAIHSISGCSNVKHLSVNVHQNPPVFDIADLRNCTDESTYAFDLTAEMTAILSSGNYTNLQATYYISEADAVQGTNPIGTPQNYQAYNNQAIYIKTTHLVTGCFSVSSFTVHLDALPVIPVEDSYVICPDYPVLVSAFTGNPADTYIWSTNATTPEIEIVQTGVYFVTVTGENGCSKTKYFGVTASEPATITDIKTTSFSESNSIEVTVSGSGSYMYILDNGSPQSSNIFNDVAIGYHTIEVLDVKGCSSALATDIAILGFPTYFTPNGDGVNDTWNIFGFETLHNTYISIFDRYGKLLKVINPGDTGWDGTFNGIELPSNDYWFRASVNDVENPFEFRGHFALKR